MRIDGWKYYNHAAVPTTAPHEEPNLIPINDGSIWKTGGNTPLFARWTTEFDCGYETNWWYVIKDTPFDINALKSKRRYEINKGNKNFYVKEINPSEYVENIYDVAIAAYATYPESYRPNVSHDQFISDVTKWNFYKVYGAFSINDGSLCGYACLKKNKTYINFCMMKALPAHEKLGLNAAMVNHILVDHANFLSDGGYICDGARSIYHETAFQNYLEKYFAFRKAFCKLHVSYNPKLKFAIQILYPIRKIFLVGDKIGLIHQINSVFRMEEIARGKNGEPGINNNAIV